MAKRGKKDKRTKFTTAQILAKAKQMFKGGTASAAAVAKKLGSSNRKRIQDVLKAAGFEVRTRGTPKKAVKATKAKTKVKKTAKKAASRCPMNQALPTSVEELTKMADVLKTKLAAVEKQISVCLDKEIKEAEAKVKRLKALKKR